MVARASDNAKTRRTERRYLELRDNYVALQDERDLAVKALKHVSFYARINHGTKCKDYGEIVDGVLKKLGVKTGEL